MRQGHVTGKSVEQKDNEQACQRSASIARLRYAAQHAAANASVRDAYDDLRFEIALAAHIDLSANAESSIPTAASH